MSTDKKINFTVEALKTKNGLLKLCEIILGAVCVGIMRTSWVPVETIHSFNMLFFSIIASLSTTSLLLFSYMLSPVAADTLPKSIFELLHHGFASLLNTAFGLAFFIQIVQAHAEYAQEETLIFLSVLGLLLGALYFMSAFYSYKSFRDE